MAQGRLALAVALLIASIAGAGQLYVIRPDGSGLRRLTDDDQRGYGSPDWSPDSRRIACDTWPVGGGPETAQIGVLGVGPGGDEPLTLLGHGAMPSWSPDGSQLVCHTYAANSPAGRGQIVVVNADGSGREAVLDQWGSPRWAPDGRRIATIRNGGLAAYDLATGKQAILLGAGPMGGYVQLGFSISPDGKRYGVAFSGGGLGVAAEDPVEGGLHVTQLAAPPAEHRHTSWSPDSRRLVAMRRSGLREHEPFRLLIYDADGAHPPEPIPGIPPHWGCFDPDWSPDGQWIVFNARPERLPSEAETERP